MAVGSSVSASRPSIGILSIGDMGMGIAKLLLDHGYPVSTVAAGRSQHTKDRINAAKIKDLDTDEALIAECDIIFSIVPPRDAKLTAKRVVVAARKAASDRNDRKGVSSLLYIDMNAVSPRTIKEIAKMLDQQETSPPTSPSIVRRLSRTLSMQSTVSDSPTPIVIKFLDGGIIGAPPLKQNEKTWRKPSVVLSGEYERSLTDHLKSTLNVKFISEEIGAASTLKACFASFSKGMFAIATLSYTTAQTAGVLPELKSELETMYPNVLDMVEKGLPGMPPKAYRWVDEMKQIGETMADQGGLSAGQTMFNGVAELYKTVADDTVLGKELSHKRKRGTTATDVAAAVKEGLEEKRRRGLKDPKMELAWRSSWGV